MNKDIYCLILEALLYEAELNEFISWNRANLYNHAKIKIGSIKTIIE